MRMLAGWPLAVVSYDGQVATQQELNSALTKYKDEAQTTAARIAIRTLVAGIPYAGSPILELIDGLAQRRTQDRLNIVFATMKDCLDRVEEEKIDRAFFESEEFQSLLFLTTEKLQSTHDTAKLKMFATALANAGNVDFDGEDKEQYVRVLRDLSVKDLNILNDEMLKGWFADMHAIDYAPEVMSSISRLQGMGLVLERLKAKKVPPGRTGSERNDAQMALSDLLTQPPKKTYHISEFGEKFLRFILSESNSVSP
jgi:hypothetical protein